MIDAADPAILTLHNRDMDALAKLVHPIMGVRFTPIATVHESQVVFLPAELPGIMDSDIVYVWGTSPMTGNFFEYTFSDYYDKFVYEVDYIKAVEIGVNEQVYSGHQTNNIHEFYSSSQFVEYHFPWFHFDEFSMWKSLRLVFIEENEAWWLVGIVNDTLGGI